MVRCLGEEPEPPTDPAELEKWCESGNSGRPIQTHIGRTMELYGRFERTKQYE